MESHPKTPRWIAFLIRRRYWLLGIAVVWFAVAKMLGGQLALDRSIENMFAPDDPILVPYRRLQRTFGEHEIVMAVYEDDQLKSPEGIARVTKLSEELRKIPGVVATVSLADPPGAADFDDTGRGAQFRDMFSAYTHNTALDAAGVICLVERPGPGKPSRRDTLAGMRRVVAARPHGVLVGEPVLIEEAFDLLEADGRRLNLWCTILVMAAILACFRRVRWLLLPLAAVQLTIATTAAILVLSRLKLSMVSSMLNASVTVVGVATAVHVMVHFLDERRAGHPRRRALANTLHELAIPIFTAVLTDVAGFAALMVSRVGPVHDFGLMTAVGSFLVLPCTLILTPGLVWLADDHRSADPLSAEDLKLERFLDWLLRWSCSHKKLIAAVGAVLAVLAILGSSRMEIETDFTKNFRKDSSIVKAYGFVEERFGGAGVWDLLIPVPANVDGQTLGKIMNLEASLKKSCPQLEKAISIADALAAGLGGPKRLEGAAPFAVRIGLGVLRARMLAFVESVYHTDPADGRQWVRVLLRSPEQLPAADKNHLIEQVRAESQAKFPDAEVTGYYVLLTRLIQSILSDQWKAFLVAAVLIIGMMLVTIRDVKLTIVTVAPNLLPSLVLFGAMGWLGLPMNMGAAMIAAVSVGLSVDGSMHYTMHYQRLRREGASRDAALASAQRSIGRAAVFATLALVAGFTTLTISDFVPTVYFGSLVSLSMLGGLIGNVVALPPLIELVEKD